MRYKFVKFNLDDNYFLLSNYFYFIISFILCFVFSVISSTSFTYETYSSFLHIYINFQNLKFPHTVRTKNYCYLTKCEENSLLMKQLRVVKSVVRLLIII